MLPDVGVGELLEATVVLELTEVGLEVLMDGVEELIVVLEELTVVDYMVLGMVEDEESIWT